MGETSYGRIMRLKEKLQILMARHSLNGQKLAKLSQVSDSEISRILQGKSRPGLDNAFRLAKAVNVSLDFLADDSLDMDASQSGDLMSPDERKVLNLTHKIGGAEVVAILENVRFLGYEVAMSRLIGAKPVIEIDKDTAGELRRARRSRPRPSPSRPAPTPRRVEPIRPAIDRSNAIALLAGHGVRSGGRSRWTGVTPVFVKEPD